jgi:hypothetical protein
MEWSRRRENNDYSDKMEVDPGYSNCKRETVVIAVVHSRLKPLRPRVQASKPPIGKNMDSQINLRPWNGRNRTQSQW